MGQQQLLLLVLGAIIVGVAIIIGINMFSESAFTANQDAVTQDCLMISARLQEWWRKPLILSGGAHNFADNLSATPFQDIGIKYNVVTLATATGTTLATDKWTNEHGTFTIAYGTATSSTIQITGTTSEKDGNSASWDIIYEINPTTVSIVTAWTAGS